MNMLSLAVLLSSLPIVLADVILAPEPSETAFPVVLVLVVIALLVGIFLFIRSKKKK